jgi:hypothetical protein
MISLSAMKGSRLNLGQSVEGEVVQSVVVEPSARMVVFFLFDQRTAGSYITRQFGSL